MLKKLRYLDYYLLVPYLLLCAIGVVMVYSASAYWIKNQYGWAETTVLMRQLTYVLLGVLLAWFFYYFKLSVFRSPGWQKFMLGVLFIMLLYLTVLSHLDPAAAINGATAWIRIGPIQIQPTEFAKLGVIIYLAHMFASRQDQMAAPDFSIMQLAQPVLMISLILILVWFQPDTGGAIIIAGITLVMLAASGISLKYGFGFAAFIAAILGLGYYVINRLPLADLASKSYKLRRLIAAVHPFAMRKLEGNQVVNSLVAIAHGGLLGVGLGNSSQKLGYLPEPYTDFILAVITEELGLIGALVVIGLIFWLIMRIYFVGSKATRPFYALISYGIATMMMLQTIFNVGAVTGVLPVTGVTLPFISYGGSSMLVLSAGMGIMLNISAKEKQQRLKQAEAVHA